MQGGAGYRCRAGRAIGAGWGGLYIGAGWGGLGAGWGGL